MNRDSAQAVEADLSVQLDALDARRADVRREFPGGVESEIIGYGHWLRNELTYSSNAIEGNTLTSFETTLVLDEDAVIPGKSLREHNEAKGHAEAWDYAVTQLVTHDCLCADDVRELHRRIVAHSLDPTFGGNLRSQPVRVAGAPVAFLNWLKVPELFEQLGAEIASRDVPLHPVLRATFAHLDLVTIHPFIDGNGRTARMLMNIMLIRAGFVAIPIYPEDRPSYLASLQAAQVSDGDSGAAFCALIVTLEHRELDRLLNTATT